MANASLVQWLEYLPSKQVARVRFPDDAPFLHWDCGRHLRHHVGRHPKTQVHGGLAQSVECALCKREAPGSKPGFSTSVWSYSVMVITLDFESSDPGSNPGRTFFGVSDFGHY